MGYNGLIWKLPQVVGKIGNENSATGMEPVFGHKAGQKKKRRHSQDKSSKAKKMCMSALSKSLA